MQQDSNRGAITEAGRRVLVEAHERDFVQWDQVRAWIASAEQRGQGSA